LMVDKLTLESFQPFLNQTFHVQFDPPYPYELTLVECKPIQVTGGNSSREPFRLLFIGIPDPFLPQRIYRLANEQIGTVDLFLVPLGPDQRGMRYESIFT